jgi:N-acetylglucosaminyldiphosphoundecaprenol N-acetyl-beta-D-mannosaminyltransferase
LKTNILGVLFDNNTVDEAVNSAYNAIIENRKMFVVTPNPEIVNVACANAEFKEILNSADIVTPDGIGIVYASKLTGGYIKQRAAGFDIVCGILEKLDECGGSVYLFGGKPGVADAAAGNLKEKYKKLVVSGTQNGYFDDDSNIIADINDKNPDLLLVCLGAPKQEKWIYNNFDILSAKVMIGAGGSIDVLAGNVKRAPDIFIKFGLEWFYRLLKQPSRFGRMMKLPLFIVKVLVDKRRKR